VYYAYTFSTDHIIKKTCLKIKILKQTAFKEKVMHSNGLLELLYGTEFEKLCSVDIVVPF